MTVAEMIEKLQTFSPDAEVKAIFLCNNPFDVTANAVDGVYEIKWHRQCSGVYVEI